MAISARRKRRRRKAPVEEAESGGGDDDEDDGGEEIGRTETDHETAEEVRDHKSGADGNMCGSDESTAEEASNPVDCAYYGKNCSKERATEVIGESVGNKSDNELAGDAHCMGDNDDSTGGAYDGECDIDSVGALNNSDRDGNGETRDDDTRDDWVSRARRMPAAASTTVSFSNTRLIHAAASAAVWELGARQMQAAVSAMVRKSTTWRTQAVASVTVWVSRARRM